MSDARADAKALADAHLRALLMPERWKLLVVCNESNNPPERLALGYLQIEFVEVDLTKAPN